jgi:hypothetical protein
MKFNIKFKHFDQLVCNINNDDVGIAYYNLVKQNYASSFPIYRDRLKFTKKYMSELATIVNQQLGWSWDLEILASSIPHKCTRI